MNEETKGALAAGAAAALLLGGAGSLAYWTDSSPIMGGSLRAGSLTLSDLTCDATWSELGDTDVQRIVPGDTVTKSCDGTLTMTGDHVSATVALDAASVATAEAVFNAAAPNQVAGDTVDISATLTGGGTVHASGAISVTITVAWPYGSSADNEAQGVSTAALDGLVLNAVQLDPHAA